MDSKAIEQSWIETWARRIEALGLAPLVLPFIEAARAFGFVGSQALLFVQPLVAGIVNDASIEQTATLLESPALLERLRACLEGDCK